MRQRVVYVFGFSAGGIVMVADQKYWVVNRAGNRDLA